jgi:hypothetical protein
MFTQNNLFGKKYILNKMEFLNSQNQVSIGLNFIIWEKLLRFKLTIGFQ